MQELIRNSLITITTILTALGIYIKTIDGLTIDIIKLKYRNVPGKKSKFNAVIELLGYILLSIYLVACFISLSQMFNFLGAGDFNGINQIFETTETGEISIIATIFSYCFFGSLGCTYLLIIFIPPMILDKIKGENIYIKNKPIKIINSLGIIMVLISIGIELEMFKEITKNSINGVKNNGLYIFENNISDENMSYLVFSIITTFASTTSCIILNSLRGLYNEIISENMFILISDSRRISTRYYLEYDEYYLMYENSIESYVKKSDIKEIKKMKIPYDENEIEKQKSENRRVIKRVLKKLKNLIPIKFIKKIQFKTSLIY